MQEEARRTAGSAYDNDSHRLNKLNVYVRWCAIKIRLGLTHNDVAEYLFSIAELLDNEPTLRYATDKA